MTRQTGRVLCLLVICQLPLCHGISRSYLERSRTRSGLAKAHKLLSRPEKRSNPRSQSLTSFHPVGSKTGFRYFPEKQQDEVPRTGTNPPHKPYISQISEYEVARSCIQQPHTIIYNSLPLNRGFCPLVFTSDLNDRFSVGDFSIRGRSYARQGAYSRKASRSVVGSDLLQPADSLRSFLL